MSMVVHPPPEGAVPGNFKIGEAWCPYCGLTALFGWDARLDIARCMVCGISIFDFYVRRFNHLWNDDDLINFERATRKTKRKYGCTIVKDDFEQLRLNI